MQSQGNNKGLGPHRIIIAGGGTGGHIFPAIAIANAIKALAPASKFLFVGAKGKMEMEKVPQAGYEIKGIDISGFNRSSLIKNLGLPFKLLKSFFQVRRIFSSFQPDAVIGVGGYSSFPVLRFAQSRGIKTFLHESNSFAGKANILLGKRASLVFVASEGMEKFFPAEKIVVSGNPVRQQIKNHPVSRDAAISEYGLDAAKTTILSIGGSLGAKNINEALFEGLEQFSQNGIQLIWQTGKPFLEKARKAAAGLKGVFVSDFISRMECAYAAADVVISRSGAMATAELCLVKKPVVFVPYPFAAEDHQTANAMRLVNKEAALIIKDGEARDKLISTAIGLAKDERKRNKLVSNISPLGIPDADEIIANRILNNLKN
ncbi:MAG: undecaprenyldiphospho-muramoylpentapeptide beta-N-acetylglucosaminyltransferase [Chitinophagaceae bacterium]|nr:undecaprenyldiphospho-muramoylpentapeptide beta-N-acetylglucosaminyltransferase [Bacteroidota bacterium]MCC6258927.1 undecaprenyldiphospho-muramoylpentapeptide beta-N-acetylglucosaminyltransferase [Chitinophagaceae bacterium]MCW5916471.1 undecaprenyldiphospho-muramoylpentapeptide beta-N-acetylglucosaminyltransferase [Ferruginibacter sp.]